MPTSECSNAWLSLLPKRSKLCNVSVHFNAQTIPMDGNGSMTNGKTEDEDRTSDTVRLGETGLRRDNDKNWRNALPPVRTNAILTRFPFACNRPSRETFLVTLRRVEQTCSECSRREWRDPSGWIRLRADPNYRRARSAPRAWPSASPEIRWRAYARRRPRWRRPPGGSFFVP